MRYRQGLVWLLGACMVVLTTIPVLAGPGTFFRGSLTDVRASADATDGAWAVASATVQNGRTVVRLNVKDLGEGVVGRTFGAHVHVGPCVAGNGLAALGHYNTGGVGTTAENEVWLDFTVTNGRTGHAVAIADFEIPAAGARSVVIHESPTRPDGAADGRIACLPLEF
ncbi:MAG TPA: hypothetical protein VMS74_12930 [Acidimicrobiia bacterium]|nr:hypothetical protein [Acidimicrobiia bacterium]